MLGLSCFFTVDNYWPWPEGGAGLNADDFGQPRQFQTRYWTRNALIDARLLCRQQCSSLVVLKLEEYFILSRCNIQDVKKRKSIFMTGGPIFQFEFVQGLRTWASNTTGWQDMRIFCLCVRLCVNIYMSFYKSEFFVMLSKLKFFRPTFL